MHTVWLVIKHDIGVMLRQRSFWFFTLFVPLLMVAVSISRGGGWGGDEDTGYAPNEANAVGEEGPTRQELPTLGLVDEGNLLQRLPPGFSPDPFVRFSARQEALDALAQGQVEQVVAIPAGFLASGQVTVYARDYQIRSSGEGMGVGFGSGNEWLLPYLINYNLTGDERLVAALRNPTPGALAKPHRVAPLPPEPEIDRALVDLVSTYLPYIFYFLLILSGTYLMRSVIAEKENRTAEVLLLSLPPRHLMAGKILATGGIVFIQLLIWAAGGLLAFNQRLSHLDLATFPFPPGFFVWAGVYLLLGYLLFAATMAAGGVLAASPREVGQLTVVLIIPLMPTLMFGSYFIENPTSPLTVGLSLFPFSAPSVVVTRLAVGPVPLWQLAASLFLLGATAYLCLALAGRLFHVGNLLSDEPFRWRRLFSSGR